jgi:pilus assembly protein FimV
MNDNNENYPDKSHPTSSDSVLKRAVTNSGDWKGKSMKVRKLAVALALVGGLGSGVAQALGLGEIELQSYLNEPLDAEIALPQSRGVDPADVFVNIASESAYERVGLNRNQFLSKLRFKVVTESDGSLAVNVSSREPLREPYLNFLLELTWPSGRLMREYAVLVDPPVYAEKSGVQDNVRAPAVSSSATGQRSSASNAAPRRQAQNRGYQRNTFGPTGPSDTLWEIAARVRPGDGVSMQQVMLAIQDLNPNAFIDGNINRLKRGEVLRMPSVDQMQSRTQAEATRVVSQQNREFQAPKRTVDATGKQSAQGDKAQAASGGDELKLLVAGDDASQSADGGSAGGDSELPGGVDAGTAVAMEELESARRENTELNSRVDDLQDQVQTLQRLLELKNNQLADMQNATSDTETAQAPAGEEAVTSEMAQGSEPGDVAEGAGTDTEAQAPESGETAPEAAADTAATSTEAEGEVAGEDNLADAAVESEEVAEASPDTETAEMPATEQEGQPEADNMEQEQAAEPDMTAEAPEQTAPEAAQSPEPASEPAVADKGFPDNIIDAITNNRIYQFALGGGLLVLLLLLLLLARRNANREKAFYEQLNSESDEDTDSFDLSLDDSEESPQEEGEDVLAEADAYIAYGRHDQAAQALETAISREPSRTDLRLKLLSVYADAQDRASFEKQFGEIEALDDEQALTAANELRGQLEEAESMPSIDDLESELRSDSFSTQTTDMAEEETEKGSFESDLANFDLSESDESLLEGEDAREESKDDLIEYDLSDISLDSDDDETSEELTGADLETEFERGLEEDETPEASDAGIDFELDAEPESEQDESSLELDEDSLELDENSLDLGEDSLELDEDSLDLDENSLDIDEDSVELEKVSTELGEESLELDEDKLDEDELGESLTEGLSEEFAEESVDAGSEGGIDSLDESFLDELDAELDKVANEDDEPFESESEESALDDLELDVSDEDLALMEEFSESVDSAAEDAPEEEDVPSLDEELDLEDALSDAAGEAPEEELPVASDEVAEEAEAPKREIADIDENDLGDDDDFDFLAGTDEAATKLDLARAYIEMGDSDGARDILEEVALEGNEEQKAEAQDLLKNMS